jgi:hypothetical protein
MSRAGESARTDQLRRIILDPLSKSAEELGRLAAGKASHTGDGTWIAGLF